MNALLNGIYLAPNRLPSRRYEIKPLDPAVFAAFGTTLLAVAVLACIVPAWRASQVNPMPSIEN